MNLKPRLDHYFKDYASYHRTTGNKALHMVGIPLIATTLLGLLSHLAMPGTDTALLRLDGGLVLWAGAAVYYLFLDWRVAVPFALFSLGMYFLGRAMPVTALWVVFVLGWILQFVGHYHYEKKSPAFYKNLEHLLVGPLWVFAYLTGFQQGPGRKSSK
jgi:uncharacterized membrane protein YGL010W